MRLFFVRHGESEANLLRKFSNSGVKHPLTGKGIAQAHELAQRLTAIPFACLYSSPVLRAQQTAQILAEQAGIPVEVTEALREWNVGIYEGTTDPKGWELHRQVQEDWFFHDKPESKMPGGENLLEIKARFIPFIDELITRYKDTDHNILCVAHGGLYLAMLPVVLKNIDHRMVVELGYAHTSPTIAELRTDGLHCITWCEMPITA